MSNQLQGKTAFVTGGSGGIGAAICKRFAAEGAQVIAADLHSPTTPTPGVEFREYDVTSESIVTSTFDDLLQHWPQLDILVNAAGIEIEKTIEDTTLEEWNRIFAVNVTRLGFVSLIIPKPISSIFIAITAIKICRSTTRPSVRVAVETIGVIARNQD